jgi:hypothetical protein
VFREIVPICAYRPLLLAVLILALSPVASTAETAAEGETWDKTNEQWFESVPASGRVRIVNPYGNVYARFGGYGEKMEILATEQRLDKAPALEVRRTPIEGGLDVVVAIAGTAAPSMTDLPPRGDRRDRVDLVVFVPEGRTLDIRTRDDMIDVKKTSGELNATTFKGDIRILAPKGRVRATSDRGAISATLETGVTAEAQSFTTVTGDIEVFVWEDANLAADLATSGRITTDFSIAIEHRRHEEPDKLGTATLGRGGPRLSLASKRGSLALLRLPRDLNQPGTDDDGEKE